MNQLKQFAIENSLTQGDLAKKLGVSREYVNRIINGRQPTASVVGRFVAAFGFAAAEQVFGTGNPGPDPHESPTPEPA